MTGFSSETIDYTKGGYKMEHKGSLTKILAMIGTLLAWLTVTAPVFFALIRLVGGRRFLFDFLMPAELFPVALIGGALLVWAAVRARSRLPIIAWGLGAAVVMLVAGQVLAVVTGLASGETEPEGIAWGLVLASLALYTLALVGMAVGGVLLLRDLFRKAPAAV